MARVNRYVWDRADVQISSNSHHQAAAAAEPDVFAAPSQPRDGQGRWTDTGGSPTSGADLTAQLTDAGLDPDTATRVANVNAAFQDRYGIGFTSVRRTDTEGLTAQVDNDTLEVNPRLLNDTALGKAEADGYLAPGVGSVEGVLTHELGHVVLQGGRFDRRAVIVADRGARKMGGGRGVVSRYGEKNRMEQEAELFAFYHRGGDRRPAWVVGWGDILHEELGVDRTPITAAAAGKRYRSPGFVLPPEYREGLAAAAEVFHPGHPDQKVHGHRRRGGAGGSDLKAAKGRYARGAGTKDDPVVTNDAWVAAQALGEGKHVQLDSPDEVGTLLDRLHQIGVESEARGEKAKLHDLCKVSVAHTNLFCAESKGVARIDMPQFRGKPRQGSPADQIPKLPNGKVDLSRPFIDHLQASGIGVSNDRVDASHLKASQRELDGVKVAGMMTAMQEGRLNVRDAFFVSKDNYVVDGHHLWAATVGREYKEGRVLNLDVQRVDAPILDVLDRANSFTADQGLPRAGMGLLTLLTERRSTMGIDEAAARRIVVAVAAGQAKDASLTEDEAVYWDQVEAALTDPPPAEVFHLAGRHNQKRHAGKGAGAGRAGMGDIPIDDARLADFRGPAGGSAAAHLVQTPGGGYAFSPERQALHDEIINKHLAGKTPVDEPVYNILGGGPAAGKSTMVNSDAGAKLRDKNTVMVNADDMKAELPEYQAMSAAKNPNAANFVHEESSYLAARLQAASFENRFNVTLDGTGNSQPAKLRGKITTAKAAGYRVEGHYVTVPTDLAVQRANARGAQTGRYVPESVVRSTHAGVSSALPQVYPDFDAVNLYDSRSNTLEHVMEWRDGSFTVHDSGLWDEFVAKGSG